MSGTSNTASMAAFNARIGIKCAPEGYAGESKWCLRCRAFLGCYQDGYGYHWVDSERRESCPDGYEHRRSP